MAVKTRTKPIEPPKQESPPEELIDLEEIKVETKEQVEEVSNFKPVSSVSEPIKPPSKMFRGEKSEEIFWTWVASLTDNEWNYLKFYLYRTWPVINRQVNDPNASINIDKFMSKFDKSNISQAHGSGDYRLMVTDDRNSYKGKGNQICDAYITIREPLNPPKVILEELIVDDRLNKSFVDSLRTKGILGPDGRIMANQTQDPAMIGLITNLVNQLTKQNTQPRDASTEAMSSMFMKTHEQSMNMLKEQVNSDSPDKWVKILEVLKGLMPKPESGNQSLELIVKMQADMAKIQADSQVARETMMMKMMEMMSAKPDASDAEDKVLARIATYKELFGGGDGGGSHKKSNLEVILEHVEGPAVKVLDLINSVINMQMYKQGLAKQPITPPPPTEQQQPQPPAIEGKNNVVEMPPNQEDQLAGTIRAYGGMIISALQRGQTGSEFAASVEGLAGPLVYEQIASVGKDQLLAAMKAVPDFWSHVAAIEPKMIAFVEDFIAYGTEEEEK